MCSMALHKRNEQIRLDRFDWDQVRTLLACARAGHLRGAAVRLGTDASTVSRRLSRLEDELGLRLFERGRHGLVATAAVEHLVPAAEEVERSMQGVARAVGAVEAEAEGVVRLTVPPGVADAFVAPLVAELHARHPRIQLELDARVSVVDLTRGEADLALRTIKPRSGELVVTRVAVTRSVPMASPAYTRELGVLRRADDARWIMWGSDLAHLPEQRWLDAYVSVAPVLRTSHFPSQLAAARSHAGVVVVPEPYGPVTGLVPLTPGRGLRSAWSELPNGELWLVGHQALRNVPRVAAVWELLVARLTSPRRLEPAEYDATRRIRRPGARSAAR